MATEVTIFGLEPVIAAVIIAAVGISFRTIFGFAGKNRKEFDYILMLRTAASAFFSAVVIVIPTLSHIAADATNETVMIIVLTQIAAVMGVDAGQHSLAKRIGKHIAQKKASQPIAAKPPEEDKTPEEEGEDVPPGKGE